MAEIRGGDKWKKILASVSAQGLALRIGILEGSTGQDGEPIAPYAFKNEYGFENIPARPFMRHTVRDKEKGWQAGFVKSMAGKTTQSGAAERSLRLLGEAAVSDIQGTIRKGMAPPNSAATIARKGPGKPPLIDTGDMIKSLSYEVEKKR